MFLSEGMEPLAVQKTELQCWHGMCFGQPATLMLLPSYKMFWHPKERMFWLFIYLFSIFRKKNHINGYCVWRLLHLSLISRWVIDIDARLTDIIWVVTQCAWCMAAVSLEHSQAEKCAYCCWSDEMDSSTVSGSSLSQMVRAIRAYSQ